MLFHQFLQSFDQNILNMTSKEKDSTNTNINSDISFFDTNRSVAVIAMSGFAGALAGLSISRSRNRSALALGHAQAQITNLPIVFAISTATFASIIEYSSILSPTKYLLQFLNSQDILNVPSEISNLKDRFGWDSKSLTTLGDSTIGGAVAGAIFSGGGGMLNKTIENGLQSPADIKNTNTNMMFASAAEKQKALIGRGKVITLASKKIKLTKRVDVKGAPSKVSSKSKAIPSAAPTTRNLGSASLPRPRRISGISTGLALGLAAGVAQITLTKLEEFVKSQSEASSEQGSSQPEWTEEQEDNLDERIKTMSTEEIQREIEVLKTRRA